MTDFDFEILLKKSLASDSEPSEILNAKLKKKLNERKPVSTPFKVLKTAAAAAVIVIMTGTVILNSSPDIATNMSRFPVIGALTDAITFRNNDTPQGNYYASETEEEKIAKNPQITPATASQTESKPDSVTYNSNKSDNSKKSIRKPSNSENSYNLMGDIPKATSIEPSQSEIAMASEPSTPVEADNATSSVGPRSIVPDPDKNDGISVASHEIEDTLSNDWGIEITCDDVTSTGLSVVISQNGGNASGELTTGEYYLLESYNEGLWCEVETLPSENEIVWNSMAYKINENTETKLDVNWENLYGELDNGKYRIGKNIMDYRAPGDYDECMYYAEFNIN